MASEAPAGVPGPTAPTGNVTFLFSDIEGSTQRWERHGEAMAAALARHDVVMRRAITAHDGFVFKTIGDAFCAAFARPGDALAAAIDAQRALRAEDFSAVYGFLARQVDEGGEDASPSIDGTKTK